MLKRRYRLLWTIAKPLHFSQAKSLVWVCVALTHCGQMRSFAIAQALSGLGGTLFQSGLQRFYRLVNNAKLDDLLCWAGLAGRVLKAAGKTKVIAVDWTEWHSGLRVLAATVCVGRRAVPIYAQAFAKQDMPRSQNTRENTFLGLLIRLSPLVRQAVLVFDRGFRRVSLIADLQRSDCRFLIRLAVKTRAAGNGFEGLLSQHRLRRGESVDLGTCSLRSDGAVRVRVIGVWAAGQAEPWWLATNLAVKAGRVAEYYDRRMSIEELFRDGKGCRFGIKMKWTQFKRSQQVSRLFLLLALAMTVWIAAGVLACARDPSLRLPCALKGPRRSLVSIGIEAKKCIATVLATAWKTLALSWPQIQTRSFDGR